MLDCFIKHRTHTCPCARGFAAACTSERRFAWPLARVFSSLYSKYGANPDARSGVDGATPLHLAAAGGHVECMRVYAVNAGFPRRLQQREKEARREGGAPVPYDAQPAASVRESAPAEDATDRTETSAEETCVSRGDSPADPTPMSSFGALAALAREDAARRAASDDSHDDSDDDSCDDSASEPGSNDENDENGLGPASNASAVEREQSGEDLVAALAAGVPGFGGAETMNEKSVHSKKKKKMMMMKKNGSR